jgi:hypothetical protein
MIGFDLGPEFSFNRFPARLANDFNGLRIATLLF